VAELLVLILSVGAVFSVAFVLVLPALVSVALS